MRMAQSISNIVAGLLVVGVGASGAMTALSGQTAARRVAPAKTVNEPSADGIIPARTTAAVQAAPSGTYRMRLSVDGLLTGRFQAADPQTGELVRALRLEVLFLQNGRVAARTAPGETGIFQAAGLRPGVYSMIVLGDVGFLAHAVELLPATEQQLDNQPSRIDAAIVPPVDFPVVRELIRAYAPAPGGLVQQSELGTPQSPVGAPLAPEPQAAATMVQESVPSHSLHVLELQADGTAIGRVVRLEPSGGQPRPVGGLNLFMISGGRIVAKSPVAPDGTFQLRGMQPGFHSLVAAGTDGFAAMGIQVVESRVQAGQNHEETILPASMRLAQDVFAVQEPSPGSALQVPAIDPADIGPVQAFAGSVGGGPGVGPLGPVPLPPPPVAAPVAGGPGGFGGGFGGPAGAGGLLGGGGGGLLGVLAGLGAGLGIGAAVFDDEEDRPVIVEVASPFQP